MEHCTEITLRSPPINGRIVACVHCQRVAIGRDGFIEQAKALGAAGLLTPEDEAAGAEAAVNGKVPAIRTAS